jgi:hypothetical protein
MKYSKRFFALAIVMTMVIIGFGCAAVGTPDFTITSSIDANHSHKVIISGADIDNPPATKTITSDGASHTHTIVLNKQDYEAIKKGQEISVISSSTGTTPHTHTFKIKKP